MSGKNGGRTTKSNIQYVAKVRYSNNLPPPSCPPKLLKEDSTDEDGNDLNTLVSSFFRKENFRNLIRLNDDLGMPINLVSLPDRETMYGLKNNGVNLELHPMDQLILSDPNRTIKTQSQSVGFLRRTQYISSDIQGLPNKVSAPLKVKKEDDLDPRTQLKQKNLKAKRVWNFLPDTSMLDQTYYDVKFMSSASISKNKHDKSKDAIKSIRDPRLLTSIMREIDVNKNTKLMSFYLTDEESSKITENAPIDDNELEEVLKDESKKLVYRKQREYDGQVKPLEELRQLAITFDEKTKQAYYIPISGKIELKKCRIDPVLLPTIKELSYDQINMYIREPTNSEIERRDALRSEFDPMEFGTDE
ncbi:hypothetical protein CAS74_002068 [Pichia kudriavzevii]|uniref:RNA polymerase II-associated protein 1 n=1 Tax=Pichia kudriavzevii TaxID=4909 RepID=A0A1Z8JPJ7_PICKU|nr:hypothetical protein CAS74_002068 [Pichia kudriavzevii]